MKDINEKEITVGMIICVSVAAGNGHGISIGEVEKVTKKRVWWRETRLGAYDAWNPMRSASNKVRWASCGNRIVRLQ